MKDPFWNGTQNGTQHYPAKPYIELPRWTDCSDRWDGDFFPRLWNYIIIETINPSSMMNHHALWLQHEIWNDDNDQADFFFSSNLYRDYLKTVALPKLDSIHNVSSNSTGPLEKIYDNWNSDHQEHGNCTYGSGMNQVNMSIITTNTFDHDQHHDTITMQLTMTYITFTGWLSYAGCYAASLSSAIASLIGAPRILQVAAQHPGHQISTHFTLVSGGGQGWDLSWDWLVWKGWQCQQRPNPRFTPASCKTVTLFSSGYFLCFSVAMGFVMIANLNVIGIVASNFFLARCHMDIIDMNYANMDKDMRIWIFIFYCWIGWTWIWG